MNQSHPDRTRRTFIKRAAFLPPGFALPAFWNVPGAFAEALTLTPRQTEGPFYPDHLPLDTDNDLIIVNDNITPAIGKITHLVGPNLSTRRANRFAMRSSRSGRSTAMACICTRATDSEQRDANFQGFGRFLTGSTANITSARVKPVPYPGRTPHIHFMIKRPRHGRIHHAVLHQGQPAERPRRRLPWHPRRQRLANR